MSKIRCAAEKAVQEVVSVSDRLCRRIERVVGAAQELKEMLEEEGKMVDGTSASSSSG